LPLKIGFKTTVTFEVAPFVSAITRGALLDVRLDNLKMLRVNAISSIKLEGMDRQKIYRFYFDSDSSDKRLFLQVLADENNPQAIEEILFCSSVTELPESADDIAFFTGQDESGLGEIAYRFSRDDLTSFLAETELDKRLGQDDEGVEYTRIDDMEFMPAFTGVETRIFDAYGTSGERVDVLNLMPHTRALSGGGEETFIVGFWVMTSKNGRDIAREDQLPVAEYIFAIKLEAINIKVI
jgi:hypothetical protein